MIRQEVKVPNHKPELYTNNYQTTLSSGVNDSTTTIPVTAAPPSALTKANCQWRLIIESEIMLVTGVSGSNLTVIRGYDGSTNVAHSSGIKVANIFTAQSTQRIAERNFWPGTRRMGRMKTAKLEYDVMTSSQTITLLDLPSGAGHAGCICGMFLSFGSTDFMGRERTLVKVYRDQEGTPSINCTVVNLHCADYAPNNAFEQRFCGYNDNPGYNNHYIIPYSDGIKITLTNGSSTANTDTVSYVQYFEPEVPMDWDRMYRLKNFEQRISGITALSNTDLLNISGRGSLFGVYCLFDPYPATSLAYLEGNIQIYIDGEGTPSIIYPGTEDFFMAANYFKGGFQIGDRVGCTRHAGYLRGAYRFFEFDPIEFETGIQIVWPCGQSGQGAGGTFTGTCYLSSNALYYLDQ